MIAFQHHWRLKHYQAAGDTPSFVFAAMQFLLIPRKAHSCLMLHCALRQSVLVGQIAEADNELLCSLQACIKREAQQLRTLQHCRGVCRLPLCGTKSSVRSSVSPCRLQAYPHNRDSRTE